jgi:hypothetical protein
MVPTGVVSLGRHGVDRGRRHESFVGRSNELGRTIGVRADQEAGRLDDLPVDDDGLRQVKPGTGVLAAFAGL